MKSNDFINENIVMDAHEMHKDHEVQMARKDCYHAAEDAIALHKLLRNVSEEQGVESWVFAKITLANDYLRTVREYMEYNLMNPDQSAGMAAEPTPEMPLAENASSGASGAGNMAGVNNPKTKKAKSKVGTLFGGTYKAKGSPFAESKKTNVKPGAEKVKCPTCKGTGDKPGVVEGMGSSSPTRVMRKYLPKGMWDPILSHSGKSKHDNADGSKTSHVWRLRNLVRSWRGREFDAWKQAVEQELGSDYQVTSAWPTPSVRHIQMNNISAQQGVAEGYSLKKIKREK